MPGTGVVEPVTPLVMSQTASASFSVARTTASVAAGDTGRPGRAGSTRKAGTGATRGCERGHTLGGTPPVIQVWTAFAAQPEKSAVTVLWPTPGTTSSFPWGNSAATDAAPAVGVRMSKPPLTASTGTFGRGPGASAAPPAGLGQPRQKSALPNRAAQTPNGPNAPGGRAARADCSSAARAPTGVSGVHGNGPSRQTVAA